MRFSGLSPDRRLVEIAELTDHPFMLGSQFHPEFTSRPNRPHPLFKRFIEAAVRTPHNQTETPVVVQEPVLEPVGNGLAG